MNFSKERRSRIYRSTVRLFVRRMGLSSKFEEFD
jgi:hypothetical protein